MNVARLLVDSAARTPGAPAIRHGPAIAYRYGELAARAASLAGHLARRGVGPGDRVGIFMPNHLEWLVALQAILHAGAVAVPVNYRLHPRELAATLHHAGATICFVSEAVLSTAESASDFGLGLDIIDVDCANFVRACHGEPAALVARAADDPAWLFYTSGTTGKSKGAVLSHRNLALMTESYLTEVDAVAPSDAILHAAPLSHGSGMYAFAHLARGAAHIIPATGGFDAAEMLELFDRVDGIALFAAPTMVHRLAAAVPPDASLSGLKLLIYGGGPMLLNDCLDALGVFGPRLAQIYGQGECPMTISHLPRSAHVGDHDDPDFRRRLSSVGKPFRLVDVCIEDPAQSRTPGRTGEILVRSPLVMLGYWQDPAASAGAFDGEWLRTGDVGYFDDEGHLHLVDRVKDVIISGGSNIYAREIEDVLIGHPSVLEVAIIGRPHADWGEEVVAVIGHGDAPAPPAGELDRLCQSQVASFKRPRAYRFMRILPKNAYGKIEKKSLKADVLSPPSEQTQE